MRRLRAPFLFGKEKPGGIAILHGSPASTTTSIGARRNDRRAVAAPVVRISPTAERGISRDHQYPHAWLALDESRRLFFFVGIWRPWTGIRGTKADLVETAHLVFTFSPQSPMKVVKPIHPKAVPVLCCSIKRARNVADRIG